MKSIIFFLILMSSVVFSQPYWHIVTIDSDGWEGYTCSLELDSLNRPHIAYVRWYNPTGKDLKYAYYDGNSWIISVVVNSVDILEPSIALDTNDQPNISYQDYGYLKYAKYNGTTWIFNTIEQYGRFTAIAVDSLNHPHIAYQETETDVFKYAHFNGSNWEIQTLDTQYASGQGTNNSITTDSQNKPHISYRQDSVGGIALSAF